MKSSDLSPSDNVSDGQPPPAPEGYRIVRLPSWEMKMPAEPVNEDEEEEPIGRPREYFENPLLRRQTTSASSPWFYLGIIPVRHFSDPDWRKPVHYKDFGRRIRNF